MRTTLDIDDDILQAAKELARAECKTAGQVLSDLARKALTTPSPTGMSEEQLEYRNGFALFPRRGGMVTNQMIEDIQIQMDREDLERAKSLRR
jgi:hypothetical protein